VMTMGLNNRAWRLPPPMKYVSQLHAPPPAGLAWRICLPLSRRARRLFPAGANSLQSTRLTFAQSGRATGWWETDGCYCSTAFVAFSCFVIVCCYASVCCCQDVSRWILWLLI
jgi:hypothetical protein